ncbi:putative alpha crystallin/Hsp20 domain, HSP20-like chaperone [Arabidopsis thaliana]|uniref:Heat shock protein, putative n=6 Tax=Arabidopsis TaxID=3701 RepID=Q8LD91_ARATH|nr:heat shock protein, putative [Arabidopsis thaliana]KAG7645314.1 HSP20-like chaperone [Arabidopsis thaliana x Arabidopsis arenosa]VYS45202.1 unnamed protein product [Arabidopsis thaliana]
MEHESITARRRLAAFAAHFPATSYDSASTASLVPLNCSSNLNTVIQRCDNKISFARQASSEQGFFMRPASPDDVLENLGMNLKNTVVRRGDNRLYFARQASSAQGFFMRQASTNERTIPQDAAASTKFSATKTTGFDSSSPAYAAPHFSKPAKEDIFFPSLSPNLQKERPKLDLPKLANLGTVWSPRSNVAESTHSYVVAIELPGASINDIRVEVDNTNLTVTGRRTSICQKVDAGTKASILGYHKQEILQGPFKVSWPLPSNVNKDNVSAEFMDGILRIVIPKL